MQMDKGVLSLSLPQWQWGEAVEASLSLAGDEGIRGGDDRREARASQHPVALLVKFRKCNSADRTRMTRQKMLPSLHPLRASPPNEGGCESMQADCTATS